MSFTEDTLIDLLYSFLNTLADVWEAMSIAATIFSLVALFILIYALIRMAEIKMKVDDMAKTKTFKEADAEIDRSRLAYVRELAGGTQESDWRHAIIQADLMLDEILSEQGIQGETIDEKLSRAVFNTVAQAKEAHDIRKKLSDDISFDLDDKTTYRTIKNYEAVFTEFGQT